jgi:hypothetical protein
MPPVGFEPTISAGERPQTYALDRAATGIGFDKGSQILNILLVKYALKRLKRQERERMNILADVVLSMDGGY